jgi:deoxyribodipyrimidine photo-lyase
VRVQGKFVLYWMVATRRLTWSFPLQRAVELARELGRPLVILEALRTGYPWASDRLHRFILDGMREHRRRLARSSVLYHPYVEPETDHGKGLLSELAARACAVVTDDYPTFFIPRMTAAAAARLPVRVEAVDGNGLLPMRAAGRVFPTAYAFRRHLQKTLPAELDRMPLPNPLSGARLPRLESLPKGITRRWLAAPPEVLSGKTLARLPIDHAVAPTELRGGIAAAEQLWHGFLDGRLARYHDGRNALDDEVASGLSAHLHFGHLGAHQLVHELLEREQWSVELLGPVASGAREGWWGVSPGAEAFLDQLVTWRELGFNMCAERADHERYRSLPDWARKTLADHAADPRPHRYSRSQLEAAETHDALWNAAQRQLVREGRIHNYLRMLWGKKILEWSSSPKKALSVMLELNNRYALDGRDPNSVSGIFWVLGRYDRAWGPERPIFGKIRFMSSESARRKLRVAGYLERFGPG